MGELGKDWLRGVGVTCALRSYGRVLLAAGIGPYLFMHNGFLAEFPRLRLRMLNFMTPTVFTCVVGTSDSEHMYVACSSQCVRHTCPFHVARARVLKPRECMERTGQGRVAVSTS